MFTKIVVANRGEIACRIIRTCRRLGIVPVAVYSDADAKAPHVKQAAEAYHIGAAPADQSYLNTEKIIAVAKSCGAQAIHPGYGFLSETPAFSEEVRRAGLVFVGPSPEALRVLGKKTSARTLAQGLGVPCVPWAEVPPDNPQRARETAAALGLPVMVKASAAGGGVGGSVVREMDQLDRAVGAARSLGASYFGNPGVHLEKYIERARHVEIQTMVDQQGDAIHLMERECSLQRRYQKVVEESPSVAVSPSLRQRMADAAIRLVKAGRYVNTGTVEFLVDGQGDFYLLEVNCRIQVEHPVTEQLVNVDLVEHQLRIAAGERLALAQEQVRSRGHVIEARIYAEHPETFLPRPGVITMYREPQGDGVRVDSGVCEGYEVSVHYDPLMAKLIVWRDTREKAIDAMAKALRDFVIQGVTTNLPLLSKVVAYPAFRAGDYNTTSLADIVKSTPPPEAKGGASGVSGLRRWFRQPRA